MKAQYLKNIYIEQTCLNRAARPYQRVVEESMDQGRDEPLQNGSGLKLVPKI